MLNTIFYMSAAFIPFPRILFYLLSFHHTYLTSFSLDAFTMQNPQSFLLLLLLLMGFCVAPLNGVNVTAAKADVGVILDLDTTLGKVSKTCISMAIEDFYSNGIHSTMIVPHFKNSSSDVVIAASAAIDLLKNTQVVAIFGPQKSSQADFVIDIGDKVKVPIISPATSPALSPKESPYFIRSAWCTSSQVKAIAAIVKYFGWREVVFVYEDTNYGSGLVPFWTKDLVESNALISYQSAVSPASTEDQIRVELCKLTKMQTRVFVVHMLPALASKFFPLAKEAGMMEKGYVWIIADVLTSLVDSMDSKSMEAMRGVLGVKAYVPESEEVTNFTKRWSKRFRKENPDMDAPKLNVFGLWAYDSITVLAKAIEQVGVTSPQFNRSVDRGSLPDLEAIGTSNSGPLLFPSIRNNMSKGLSGDFNIANGELQPIAFEIVNVIGRGDDTVGFWTERCGLSSVKPDDHEADCSREKENLDPIVWPGKPKEVPKGWEIPTSGKKLRVGVPVKGGFNQFIAVKTNEKPTGFSIKVFEEVMTSMPTVQFEYCAFGKEDGQSAGNYDALVKEIYNKKYDAVVGDVTITSNRSEHADFAIPYTESGIAIVVPLNQKDRKNAWIFMKPLTTGLWLTIAAFIVFTGCVVWVLEHRVNKNFQGPPYKQVGMIFWFSFSTLVFAHRERVSSNLTRFVLIVWVFVVLVLTSSYTANLTSMLTVEQLQPKITDVSDLIKYGENVGYQKDSFVKGFLTNTRQIGIDSSKLMPYSTLEQFDEALSKGTRNGGVGAIIDELPYIRIFLAKYCHKYTMIGPTYPTSGFGFAFPKGSPLVSDVSREIVKLKENDKMVQFLKELSDPYSCSDGTVINSQRLNLDSFRGLFLIAGLSSSLALAIFLYNFLYENRYILASTASTKQKLYGLAVIFSTRKNEPLSSNQSPVPDNGERSFPAPTHQEDEGFSTIEITPNQPPHKANS